VASRRRSFTSSEVAARAVSPAKVKLVLLRVRPGMRAQVRANEPASQVAGGFSREFSDVRLGSTSASILALACK
jgi:hypothetical protein